MYQNLFDSYVQVNFGMLVILAILLYQSFRRNIGTTTKQLYFRILTISVFVLCLSDLISGFFKGNDEYLLLVNISNGVYIFAFPFIAYIWSLYVENVLRPYTKIKKHNFLLEVPIVLMGALSATNPWTHWLYTFKEENGAYYYQRGNLLFLQWIIVVLYFVYTTVRFFYANAKEPASYKRLRLRPILQFAYAPFVGCILQAFVYGLSTIQIGFTVSIFVLYINSQRELISADGLTGLNNRAELDIFFETKYASADPEKDVFAFMMDVNGFKKINDTYGHAVGDDALCDTAKAIQSSMEKFGQRCFLARYGGDEFVIVGIDVEREQIEKLRGDIYKEIENSNKANSRPYTLSISIGCSSGEKKDFENHEMLLNLADNAMYREKHMHGTMRAD